MMSGAKVAKCNQTRQIHCKKLYKKRVPTQDALSQCAVVLACGGPLLMGGSIITTPLHYLPQHERGPDRVVEQSSAPAPVPSACAVRLPSQGCQSVFTNSTKSGCWKVPDQHKMYQNLRNSNYLLELFRIAFPSLPGTLPWLTMTTSYPSYPRNLWIVMEVA